MKKTTKFVFVGALGAAVLGWNTLGVSYMVNNEISPVNAYFTSGDIAAGSVITKEMLNYIEVPAKSLPPNVIIDEEEIVGKYVKYGYSIPKNSYFFNDVVLSENDMPNSSVLKLAEGEFAFPLIVDLETSLGNGIVPDTKVDIAFRTKVYNPETEQDEPIFGILSENVRVTSVKDNNASAVFSDEGTGKNNSETKTLTKLFTFAVDSELNELLNKAVLLGEVRPIAKGEITDVVNDETMSTNEVITWIESNTFKMQVATEDKVENKN